MRSVFGDRHNTATGTPMNKLVLLIGLTILLTSLVSAASSADYVGQWRLNQGSGQTLLDSMHAYNGFRGNDSSTETADPAWSTNRKEGSYGLSLNGNQYSRIPYAPAFDIDALSAVLWMNPATYNTRTGAVKAQTIFSQTQDWKVGIDTSGNLVFALYNNTVCGGWCDNDNKDNGWITSTVSVPTNTWTEVGVTWNGTHALFYKNGALQDQIQVTSQPATINHGTSDIGIGSTYVNSNMGNVLDNTFKGGIDNIRLFNHDLPQNDPALTNHVPTISSPTPSNTSTIGNDPQTLSVSAGDADNDLLNVTFYDNAGNVLSQKRNIAPGTVSTSYSGFTSGTTYHWHVTATDGNALTTAHYQFTYVSSGPTTTDNWTVSGWQSQSSAAIKLTATDSDGVAKLSYRVDSGKWKTVSGSSTTFSIATTGNHTIEYNATDTKGATESTKHDYVAIDAASPDNTLNAPTSSTWLSTDFQVRLQDTDSGSGIASCSYRAWDTNSAEPGTWQLRTCNDNTSTITVSSSGTCYTEGKDTCNVRVRTTDRAGNTKTQLFAFNIDYTPLTSSDNITTNPTPWESHPVPVQITCSNGGIGCGIQWRVKNSTGQVIRSGGKMQNTLDVQNGVGYAWSGDLTLEYRANDTRGNLENPLNTQEIRVDLLSPTTTITSPSSGTTESADFTVSVNDADNGGSGYATCQYRVNDTGRGTSTGWTSRSCGGSFTVTVGTKASDYCQTEGSNTCTVETRVFDNAGNTGTDQTDYNINIVNTNPPTTQLNESYTDTWKLSPQNLAIRCTDSDPGCDWVRWRVTDNNGNTVQGPQTYDPAGVNSPITTPWVTISADGVYHLQFYGADGDGNTEATWIHGQQVRIDTTNPSTTLVSPSDTTYLNNDFQVRLQDTDSGSGIASCSYRAWDTKDAAPSWQSRTCNGYTNTITVGKSHSNTCYTQGQDACLVEVRTTDKAGNTYTTIYRFDIRYSKLTSSDNITTDPTPWETHPVPVQMTCKSGGISCGISWRVLDSSGSVVRSGGKMQSTVDVPQGVGRYANGDLTLQYAANDSTGRTQSPASTQGVRVDPQRPTTSITGTSPSQPFSNDFKVSISDTDQSGLSGIDSSRCQYRVRDNQTWTNWRSRTCNSQVSISVGLPGSGADCTTDGGDMCDVQARSWDNAGNPSWSGPGFAQYDIVFAPSTTDNYTATDWKRSAQPIKLTCTDNGGTDPCSKIEWKVMKYSTVVKAAQNDSGTTTQVKVGDTSEGELTLYYRGWDNEGNTERWKTQTVKIAKHAATTEILSPSGTNWYNSSFNVAVNDTDGPAPYSAIDAYYIIDTSGSFFSEWNTMESNVDYISQQVRDNSNADLDQTFWGLNNSYNAAGGARAICENGETLPDSFWPYGRHNGLNATCARHSSLIDSVVNVNSYVNWLYNNGYMSNTNVRDYYPIDNTNRENEAPKEGWGMGDLQVLNQGTWRDGAYRVIINIGDQDANGGDYGPDPSCGDTTSWDLTSYLQNELPKQNISVYSMLGDSECSDTNNGASYNEMDAVGQVYQYGNQDELVQNILDAFNQYRANTCQYRVNDTGRGTSTGWTSRSCPDGGFAVTVGTPGSGADCTTSGVGTCVVTARVGDLAGNLVTDTIAYNVDVNAPTATDNYTKAGWQNTSQPVKITCSDTGSPCSQVEWRLMKDGSVIRGPQTVPGATTTVTVGQTYEGQLTLQYRGQDSAGHLSAWNSTTVLIDKEPPTTAVTGPTDTAWYNDDITVTVNDADQSTLSGINTSTCAYRINNSGTFTAWTSRSCPDGGFTVTVGTPGSGANCTTQGQDVCTVQTRIQDNAGNSAEAIAQYNIDYTPPKIQCNSTGSGCDQPDPIAIHKKITFTPIITDQPGAPNAGWDTALICQDSSCSDPYCSFTNSSPDNYCEYQADTGYGTHNYCIQATDTVGNTNTTCRPDLTFQVLAGLGDACNADDQCLFGSCQAGVCKATRIPPPEIILH